MIRHRVPIGMFCTASVVAPIRLRSAARSAARFWPSAVTGGSFPFGGSTIIDVRRSFLTKADWLLSSPNCVKS